MKTRAAVGFGMVGILVALLGGTPAPVAAQKQKETKKAAAQPGQPAQAPVNGSRVVTELMQPREAAGKAMVRSDTLVGKRAAPGKGVPDKEEVEIQVKATAGRKIGPNGTQYYVSLSWQSGESYLGGITLAPEDALGLIEFAENPMAGLPPAAAAGENSLLYRSWKASDCLHPDRYNPLILDYRPATGQLTGINGFDPKAFGTAIRAALKDVDTLKTYPAKR